MKHLPPDQQYLLFELAKRLSNPEHRASALAGLAKSIEVLDEGQRETVLTQALSLPDRFSRQGAVCALAAQMEHLNPTQRSRLVDAILHLRSPQEIGALGPHLEHLEDRSAQ